MAQSILQVYRRGGDTMAFGYNRIGQLSGKGGINMNQLLASKGQELLGPGEHDVLVFWEGEGSYLKRFKVRVPDPQVEVQLVRID